MAGACGKWLSVEEYANVCSLDLESAVDLIETSSLMTKSIGGQSYVWIEDPDRLGPVEIEPRPSAARGDDGEIDDQTNAAAEETVEGEALVARVTGVESMALQTERALSLVERSLNAFMMMHQEVSSEKDRFAELSSEGVTERDQLIEDGKERIEQLELHLRDKEQEISDLKMLVEIMEGGKERVAAPSPSPNQFEKASVGDLIEEQLRYIMEDQMIKNLLEK